MSVISTEVPPPSHFQPSDDLILCIVRSNSNLCYRVDAHDITRHFAPLQITQIDEEAPDNLYRNPIGNTAIVSLENERSGNHSGSGLFLHSYPTNKFRRQLLPEARTTFLSYPRRGKGREFHRAFFGDSADDPNDDDDPLLEGHLHGSVVQVFVDDFADKEEIEGETETLIDSDDSVAASELEELKVMTPLNAYPLRSSENCLRPSKVTFGGALLPGAGFLGLDRIVTTKTLFDGTRSNKAPSELHFWDPEVDGLDYCGLQIVNCSTFIGSAKCFPSCPHQIHFEQLFNLRSGQEEAGILAWNAVSECGVQEYRARHRVIVNFGSCEGFGICMTSRDVVGASSTQVECFKDRDSLELVHNRSFHPTSLLGLENQVFVGDENGLLRVFDLRKFDQSVHEHLFGIVGDRSVTFGNSSVIAIQSIETDETIGVLLSNGALFSVNQKTLKPLANTCLWTGGQGSMCYGDLAVIGVDENRSQQFPEEEDSSEAAIKLVVELGQLANDVIFDFSLCFPDRTIRIPKWILSDVRNADLSKKQLTLTFSVSLSPEKLIRCLGFGEVPKGADLLDWYILFSMLGMHKHEGYICLLAERSRNPSILVPLIMGCFQKEGDVDVSSFRFACLNGLASCETRFRRNSPLLKLADSDLRLYQILFKHETASMVCFPEGKFAVKSLKRDWSEFGSGIEKTFTNVSLVASDGTTERCHLGVLLDRSVFFRQAMQFHGIERHSLISKGEILITEETLWRGSDLSEFVNVLYTGTPSPAGCMKMNSLFRLLLFATMYRDRKLGWKLQDRIKELASTTTPTDLIVFLLTSGSLLKDFSGGEVHWIRSLFMKRFRYLPCLGAETLFDGLKEFVCATEEEMNSLSGDESDIL